MKDVTYVKLNEICNRHEISFETSSKTEQRIGDTKTLLTKEVGELL